MFLYYCTPVLLHSCTPVLLYSCTPVLLYSCTPVLLYSCTPTLLSPKLKTKYRYENQLWNPGFKNGVMGSFVDINIFIWTVFYLISSYSPFFKISLIKIYTNVKTPKRKLGSFVQRYSFKFRALKHYMGSLRMHIKVHK